MTTFRIGDLEVTRVEDFVDPAVPLKFLLPDLPDTAIAEHKHWLAPRFLDPDSGSVAIHIQSWLLRTRHHTILIDTCVGNHKSRHFPPFHQRETSYLANLAAAGATPEQIDYVFCTHLHSDHVGWNTRLENGRWVPTFRNARHLFSRRDYEALDPRNLPEGHRDDANEAFQDSVLPVVEAGLAEFVDGVHQVGDGLTIVPAPGHSPGHNVMRVEDRGESGLFIGDVMHHPMQIALPKCNSFACADPTQARASRRRVLEECCAEHRLLVPGHFAAPHRGFVSANGEAFAFEPQG
jgi:glyoxylase-like metal-dependent hydrolase (beta-lactamase superfamily II)